MNTMKWLVRREFWEHKGSMFWAPLVVGALMVAFIGATIAWGISSGEMSQANVTVNGNQANIAAVINTVSPEQRAKIVGMITGGYLATSAPLIMMLSVISFFYCLGALYDERRDRSILFWKSLPLSDQMTVLSKVVAALLVAPLITIAFATATSLLLLLIACAALAVHGVNVFGMVLTNPALYLAPLQLVGLLPVYALWALPTVGWLLMVSAWARSKVFLWAVGTPIIAIVVVKWANILLGASWNIDWFAQNVVVRGLFGLVPGMWLSMEHVSPENLIDTSHRLVDMSAIFKQSWLTLAAPSAWMGAIAGVAMIVAAIRLRRWKDEG